MSQICPKDANKHPQNINISVQCTVQVYDQRTFITGCLKTHPVFFTIFGQKITGDVRVAFHPPRSPGGGGLFAQRFGSTVDSCTNSNRFRRAPRARKMNWGDLLCRSTPFRGGGQKRVLLGCVARQPVVFSQSNLKCSNGTGFTSGPGLRPASS